jgi:hypothetical protein
MTVAYAQDGNASIMQLGQIAPFHGQELSLVAKFFLRETPALHVAVII